MNVATFNIPLKEIGNDSAISEHTFYWHIEDPWWKKIKDDFKTCSYTFTVDWFNQYLYKELDNEIIIHVIFILLNLSFYI